MSALRYAHPEVLVTTDWVAPHAKDANVRVVEVDVDTKAYDESHVPGAIAWAWNTQLCDTVIRDIAPKPAVRGFADRSPASATTPPSFSMGTTTTGSRPGPSGR